eukprot:2050866-Amphidinium_carterae.1
METISATAWRRTAGGLKRLVWSLWLGAQRAPRAHRGKSDALSVRASPGSSSAKLCCSNTPHAWGKNVEIDLESSILH